MADTEEVGITGLPALVLALQLLRYLLVPGQNALVLLRTCLHQRQFHVENT